MRPEEVAAVIKRLRREPLHRGGAAGPPVFLEGEALHRLVPHRTPFLLIDAIDGFDAEAGTARGRRHIRPDDPIFAGHFPGRPVYPGVLQVEAMGQIGLCLARLLGTGQGGPEAPPPDARATHIHHAMFLAPVEPGDDVVLHAGLIEDLGLTAISAGQVFKGSVLCACAVQEVCFVD